jgi:hypothetical protein
MAGTGATPASAVLEPQMGGLGRFARLRTSEAPSL